MGFYSMFKENRNWTNYASFEENVILIKQYTFMFIFLYLSKFYKDDIKPKEKKMHKTNVRVRTYVNHIQVTL